MSEYLKRLEDRIRMLKHDYRANNDWRRVKTEIQKRGGKWVAENGTVFELKDGAIYQHMSESGIDNVVITALDAPIPYVAELHIDLQFTPPEKRRQMLEELNKEIHKRVTPGPQVEIVVIVEHDWLSKITKNRWGTIHWQNHLKPTQMTLDSRRLRREEFNPNMIYPGDTFEVTH